MFFSRKRLIFSLITLSLLLTFATSAWAADSIFSDVKATHWARPAIEEMNAAAVIKGYPDGTFKPNNAVSIHDTFVMLIRAKNLEAQTANYANRPYQFAADLPDGSKGYLAMAADNKWINPAGLNKISRNQPLATRQEIAIILAAAFNLSGNGSNLPFTDTNNSIFQQYKNHIAGVYEAGLMRGRDATTFDPLAKVTRAELAAIFARMTDLGMIAPNSNKRAEGKISYYNAGSKQITFTNANGSVTNYTVADNAAVYDYSKPASLSSISAAKPVRIYLDSTNKVCFVKTISNYSSSTGSTVDITYPDTSTTTDEVLGIVEDLSFNSLKIETLAGKTKSYQLSASPKVYDEDGDSISLLELTADKVVRLKLTNNLVTGIYLQEVDDIEGEISSIDDDEIEIYKGSKKYSFDVDDDNVLVVDEDDDDYDYDDLERGYKVEITYNDDDDALKIKVLDDETDDKIVGTIYDLENDEDDEDDWEITIYNQYDDKETYDVDEDVDVYDEDGDRIDFEDLSRSTKNYVILYLDSRDDVEEIELAVGTSGEITDLDDDEIELDNDETFDLPRSFDIDDYIIGSEVTVYVHDDEVVYIEVDEAEDDITVPGEIYRIDEDDYEITIEQESGNRFTFDVDKKVDINDDVDDDNLDFDELEKDWQVELELEDNEVVEITITDK